jgi:hypothetical protein
MKKIIPLILIFLFFGSFHANAFWTSAGKAIINIAKISKSSKALPDDEIIRFAKLASEANGTKRVGQTLGKLNLPNDVLEDIYMRIAIQQHKMSRKEAEAMFTRLTGTQGFRTTLGKVIGNNPAGTAGHLNELRIADNATMHGFKVSGIGQKFVDGIKKAPTDIDIVLKKGNKTFAVEAKNYSSTTKISMVKYRADLDTLVQYRKVNSSDNVVPVFSFTHQPSPQHIKMLQYEADKRGVQFIVGSPEEQIIQLKLLSEILP